MGTHYDQLNESEREVISRLRADGRSIRAIARILARSASTISRELRRNGRATNSWPGGYGATRAQSLTVRRRYRGRAHKLARQPDLRNLVRDSLAMGWSPAQIAGRLARQHGRTIISHESIYRFIYHRSAQKDYWHRLLPQAKHRRGRLGRRGGSPVERIRDRLPLSARPSAAADRRQPGHWEADLMLFRRHGHAVLVTHERTSRFTVITRQPNKAAQPVLDSLLGRFRHLPKKLRRSITFDNGTEFALHHRLNAVLDMQTFFCDPHAPWQKGGIENAIGRLRRPLPRKSDLATISQDDLDVLTTRYNQTPRQCLGFRTPAEVFTSFFNHVALET
ncbi:MAG: IS30 family transposase [Rhodospirillales bacterium]|nr:IS30 family transposase [Rhodospirillales bacterium]